MPSLMTSRDLLVRGRSYVMLHWSKTDGYGAPEPARTCAIGAIGWASRDTDYGVTPLAMLIDADDVAYYLSGNYEAEVKAIRALWAALPEDRRRRVPAHAPYEQLATDVEDYNDHADTTKGDVVRLYDRAIAILDGK